MSKFVSNVGRMIGGAVAGAATAKGRKAAEDPLVGAAVGAATMYVARKFLPPRVATIGAALAAGYVTRKLALRADRIANGEAKSLRLPRPRKVVKARPAKP